MVSRGGRDRDGDGDGDGDSVPHNPFHCVWHQFFIECRVDVALCTTGILLIIFMLWWMHNPITPHDTITHASLHNRCSAEMEMEMGWGWRWGWGWDGDEDGDGVTY